MRTSARRTDLPRPRRWRHVCVGLGISLTSLGFAGGCNEDAALVDFKNASAGTLADGLKTIFSGLIDGAFAALLNTDTTTPASGG